MERVSKALSELRHDWNAFRDDPANAGYSSGPSMPFNRGQARTARYFNDKSMIGTILTRLAVDVAMVEFYHARLDPLQDVPIAKIRDSLNERLTLRANIDQTAFALKLDMAFTMFTVGTVAVVPIDATINPAKSTSYDIESLRVGTVDGWFPRRVTVNVYDDREVDSQGQPVNGGIRKQLTLPKDQVAIVENPFYTIMNEPNGLLQRLLSKLEILDGIDAAVGSGKLDLIMQLPYTVRGQKRQDQAEKRRQDLRDQLVDDELGIGYIDASEKVIQLNRPIDNKLLEQIETLYAKVMDAFGMTPGILNGSASADELNSYYDRTIEPIAEAFRQEFLWKFLTKTARTQRHSVETFRDPLKLIPIGELAEITDKVLRNAAITANELRPRIGYFPSQDPRANQLANPNMPAEDQPVPGPKPSGSAAPAEPPPDEEVTG